MRYLKFLAYAILFLYLVILFLPKENLYYFAEHRLSKYNISFDNENLSDTGATLNIEGLNVSYNQDGVARVERLFVSPFIVYNKVEAEKIHFAKSFQNFMPSEVDAISFKFSPLFPIKVWINLKGNFGRIHGSYNIYSKQIYLILEPEEGFSKKYPLIYSNFKNVEEQLVYESSF